MPTAISAKTKINVSILTGVIFAGIAMFALAGLGFMKTEIEPTIKYNLPGWSWSFQNPDNYAYNHDQIKIENYIVQLKENQAMGEIKNNYPYSYGCYPNPAVAFIVDFDGEVNFQISKDNLNWYYWHENIWKNAQEIDQNNSIAIINKHIIDFYPRTLDQFYFKAILNKQGAQLRRVAITCDTSTINKFELYPQSL